MPQTNLNVAVIPVNMVPGDVVSNIDFIESRIAALRDETDIAIVPEMCNTGYTIDPELVQKYAENMDGYSLTRFKEIASKYNLAIWGTLAIKDGARLYNRGFMISPDGTAEYYDKHHLFVLGHENELYTPGEHQAPIVTFRGWRLKMSICYDLRFPVWNRWTDDRPYDALIVPANWPDARSFAWKNLLLARAIENQAYVIGCNRLGSDPYGNYHDDISYIFNHWGDDVADRSSSGVITSVFDGPRLERDRVKFPNLALSDKFKLYID